MQHNRRGSAKTSLRWSLFPRGKRGVSNIVLMLGVALCMAILLIGGFLIVTKFVQAQAKASPEYVKTELITLINTVQAAPETVTFEYYTETDQNGYPVIGSLEINDAKSKLCVHPKTENEIFGSIVDQAAIGAGFGAIGYAPNRVRSAVAARATAKAAATNAMFGDAADLGMSKKLLYKFGEDSEKGELIRRAGIGAKLSAEEEKTLQKILTKAEQAELGNAEHIIRNNPTLLTGVEASILKPEGAIEHIQAKIPYSEERKMAVFGENTLAYFQRNGEKSWTQRIWGGVKAGVKAPGKVMLGVGKGVAIGATIGAAYYLTGGDWQTTGILAVQLIVMKYVPKLVEFIVTRVARRFAFRFAEVIPVSVAERTAFEIFGNAAKINPEPFSKAAMLTAAAFAKLAEVITNVAFSIYNMIELDLAMLSISSASGHQVQIEKDSLACGNFQTAKTVLLTPPNCNPSPKYGEKFESWRAGLAGTFFTSATLLGAETVWVASNTLNPNTAVLLKLPDYLVIAAELGAPIGALVANVYQDPTGMIPRSECDSSCDSTYLRQDCPNWFLSQEGLSAEASGWTFVGLLQGGPACAALSAFGIAGSLCDATRVMAAIGVFLTLPSEVYNFFFHGYEVGLNKPYIGSKTAPEFPALTNEFSANTGYWYAELPYVIEMTKVYTNGTTSDARNPPIIIRKV